MSTTSRILRISAARRMRSSVPSGRTMCLRSVFARRMISYSNMSGVTRTGRSIDMRPMKLVSIHPCFDHAEGRGDLPWIIGGEHALQDTYVQGGRVGVGGHDNDRHRRSPHALEAAAAPATPA